MYPVIKFAKPKDERAWFSQKFHPLLYEVVELALTEFYRHGYETVVVTSGIRSRAEDKKVHGTGIHTTGRAIDLAGADQQTYEDVEKVIQMAWEYDPKRPRYPVAYGDLHGTGPHLHVQVCNFTKRR